MQPERFGNAYAGAVLGTIRLTRRDEQLRDGADLRRVDAVGRQREVELRNRQRAVLVDPQAPPRSLVVAGDDDRERLAADPSERTEPLGHLGLGLMAAHDEIGRQLAATTQSATQDLLAQPGDLLRARAARP